MGNVVTSNIFPPEKEKLIYPKICKIPNKKIYGWKRDIPDYRDIYYKKNLCNKQFSKIIDLRSKCPDIYNQGSLGSCTANALGFLFEFDEIKKNKSKEFRPSRLFIYYNERKMEDTIDYDAGASIRDGIKSINRIGVCDEKLWEYDIDKFKEKPPSLCYIQAKKYKSIKYYKLNQDEYSLKSCLEEGFPFIVGISIYESFESKNSTETGIIKMPKENEKLLGGHAVAVVGYDDNYGFLVRNSWGSDWGIEGYCYIPYEYIYNKDLANDLWTIRTISF